MSVDPQPRDDEFECARCGAHVYMGLTRCPECGVNLYEPKDDFEDNMEIDDHHYTSGILSRIKYFFHRLFGRPYSAEEVFGDSLDQAFLYNDLLHKVGGDGEIVERLIAFESRRSPDGNRITWLKNAIRRWERDNRLRHSE
jgi:hypothetical protein